MALLGSQIRNLGKLTENIARLRLTAPIGTINSTTSWIQRADYGKDAGATYDPRPKRPLSSCLLYVMNNSRPGGIRKEEISRLTQKWRGLAVNEKRVLDEQSKKAWDDYNKKVATWKKALSATQKAMYLADLRKRRERRIKMRSNLKAKELGRPVQPAIAGYTIFVQDNYKKAKGTKTEIFGELATKWKALTDIQRKIYNERGQKQKEAYMQELRKWEAKMEASGHGSVVSSLRRQNVRKVVSTKAKKRAMKKVPATKKMLKKKVAARPAAKKVIKKTVARKTATKPVAKKTATARKPAAKSVAARKPIAKGAAVRKVPAKKAPARKPAVKKTAKKGVKKA